MEINRVAISNILKSTQENIKNAHNSEEITKHLSNSGFLTNNKVSERLFKDILAISLEKLHINSDDKSEFASSSLRLLNEIESKLVTLPVGKDINYKVFKEIVLKSQSKILEQNKMQPNHTFQPHQDHTFQPHQEITKNLDNLFKVYVGSLFIDAHSEYPGDENDASMQTKKESAHAELKNLHEFNFSGDESRSEATISKKDRAALEEEYEELSDLLGPDEHIPSLFLDGIPEEYDLETTLQFMNGEEVGITSGSGRSLKDSTEDLPVEMNVPDEFEVEIPSEISMTDTPAKAEIKEDEKHVDKPTAKIEDSHDDLDSMDDVPKRDSSYDLDKAYVEGSLMGSHIEEYVEEPPLEHMDDVLSRLLADTTKSSDEIEIPKSGDSVEVKEHVEEPPLEHMDDVLSRLLADTTKSSDEIEIPKSGDSVEVKEHVEEPPFEHMDDVLGRLLAESPKSSDKKPALKSKDNESNHPIGDFFEDLKKFDNQKAADPAGSHVLRQNAVQNAPLTEWHYKLADSNFYHMNINDDKTSELLSAHKEGTALFRMIEKDGKPQLALTFLHIGTLLNFDIQPGNDQLIKLGLENPGGFKIGQSRFRLVDKDNVLAPSNRGVLHRFPALRRLKMGIAGSLSAARTSIAHSRIFRRPNS